MKGADKKLNRQLKERTNQILRQRWQIRPLKKINMTKKLKEMSEWATQRCRKTEMGTVMAKVGEKPTKMENQAAGTIMAMRKMSLMRS